MKRYLLGQFWVLQSIVIVFLPGQVPPSASSFDFVRDRDLVPLPQVFEHLEYWLHLDHSQFTKKICHFDTELTILVLSKIL